MKTRVVHVNDRVPGAVYIGRANPWKGLKGSLWANPWVVGKDGTRDEVIEKYRFHSYREAEQMPEWVKHHLRAIVGKPLACWCRHDGEDRTEENACHGDVLIALIEELGLEGSG